MTTVLPRMRFKGSYRKATRMALADRVSLGARLLDEVRPSWFRLVSPAGINMLDEWTCVLGQAYGSYTRGVVSLGGPVWFATPRPLAQVISHGFYVPGLSASTAARLRWEWTLAIRSRQAARRRKAT